MEKFLERQVFHPFSAEGDFCILNIGYNDFSKPDLAPNIKEHFQTFYTLHYVLSGSGTVVYGGNTFHPHAGSLFFLPPNQAIQYYPNPDDPWEYVWFAFDGVLAPEYGTRMGFSAALPVQETLFPQAIYLALDRLFRPLSDNANNDYFLALSVFYEILHHCLQSAPAQRMTDVKRMIELNCAAQDFSIQKLCQTLCISHSHFCRSFKEKYGISAIRYLVLCRLEHAKRLLSTSNLPVKTVAYSCGFRDELHFMKSFKAATGMTALQYRRHFTKPTP